MSAETETRAINLSVALLHQFEKACTVRQTAPELVLRSMIQTYVTTAERRGYQFLDGTGWIEHREPHDRWWGKYRLSVYSGYYDDAWNTLEIEQSACGVQERTRKVPFRGTAESLVNFLRLLNDLENDAFSATVSFLDRIHGKDFFTVEDLPNL